MGEYTTWVAILILNAGEHMDNLCEHLAMNDYTYNTDGVDTLFVLEDELSYVITIMNDRNIDYVIR